MITQLSYDNNDLLFISLLLLVITSNRVDYNVSNRLLIISIFSARMVSFINHLH